MMKKGNHGLIAFLLAALLLPLAGAAQVATQYTFSSSTGNAYNLITGGTNLVNTPNVVTGGSTDDDDYYLVPIGFSFYYNGVSFTNCYVSANGFVKLGANTPWSTYAYGPPVGYEPNTIAAFSMDMMGQGNTDGNSMISYELQGFAPFRTLVVQYRNWSIYPGNATTMNEKYNFQIKLHENDGNGYPEICYGQSYSALATGTVQVGISGSANIPSPNPSTTPPTMTDFSVRTGTWVSSTASAVNNAYNMNYSAGNMPDSGLIYKWAIPPSNMVLDSFSTVGVTGGVATGTSDNPILAAVVYTHGNANRKFITELTFNATGTTSLSDITAVKVYYTGTNAQFSASAPTFGNAIYSPSSNTFIFTGLDSLSPGPNYFWLAYDISMSATIGNAVDAQCTNIVDSFIYNNTPNITSPAGNRSIIHPLSGSYTINAAGTGPANFVDFASALNALYVNGVNGPVTFDIAPGTYNMSSTLTIGAVNGVNDVNRITFDGGNKANTVFTGSLSSAPIVTLNGATFVTLRNITITNTASGACSGVILLGSTSTSSGKSCRITNCAINLPNNTSGNGAAIGLTGDPTGNTYSSSVIMDSVVIDSNVLNGGNYGIGMFGALSILYNKGLKIQYNTFTNMRTYSIWLQYVMNSLDISYNTITNPGSGSGIYMNRCEGANSSHLIYGNKVSGFATYGIYLYSGTSALPMVSRLYNNVVVGDAGTNCLYVSLLAPSPIEVYHNTLIYKATTTTLTSGPLFTGGSPYLKVKNNICINTSATGSNYAAYLSTSPAGNDVNYNVYYNANPANMNLMFRAAGYSPATYKSATAGGDSSFNELPQLVSDYKLKSGCSPRSALDLTFIIPTDVDGTPRSTTPYIGAHETSMLANDLGVEAILSPSSPITAGLNDVVFRVRNYGNTSVYLFNAGYIHNNGTPVTNPIVQTLNTCDTMTVTFNGIQQVNLTGSNELLLFTDAPNSSVDGNADNDTLRANFFGPMSGTYTVGGTNPNFATVVDAVNGLVQSGIAGPVTFNVAPGTYTGQVVINSGTIPGFSNTTPVEFIGANAATTIITANVNQQAAVLINKCKYITFRNFTVNNTNASNPVGIAIVGATTGNDGSGCKIKNCIVNLGSSEANTSYGIIVTASVNGYGITNSMVDSVEIDSNIVLKGYYGIVVRGNQNAANNRMNKVRGNTVNAYYMGIYAYYIYNTIDVMNNTINMSPAYPATGTNYGLYFYYNQNTTAGTSGHRITGNRINNTTYFGAYIYYYSSPATSPAIIANNIVMGGKYSTSVGMYIYTAASAANVRVYHNTVIMNVNGSATTYAMQFYNSTGTVQEIKNNILGINADIAGDAFPLYCSNNLAALTIDNNVYFNNTSNQVIYRGGIYTTANFQTAAAGGLNSSNAAPVFMNTSSGILYNGCYRGANVTADVPTDINNTARSTSPSIGAIEYVPVLLDASVDSVITSAVFTTAPQNLVVKVRNNGSSAITSLNISYSLNNGTPVNETWTGNLAPCASAYITFSGAKQVTLVNGLNTIRAYSTNPNSGSDGNMSNDTADVSLKAPLSGTYVIGTAPSDYTTLTAAVSDLKDFGVSGPVVLDMKPGVYTESVLIANVPGSSATNTVTIKSQNNSASTVTLTYPTVDINPYVIGIYTSNIKVRHLTITPTGATYSRGIEMRGSVSNNEISGCIVNVTSGNYTTDAYVGIYCRAVNGTGNTIRNNTLNNGAYGIYLNGVSTAVLNQNTVIDSNMVQNAYYYSMYFQYTSNLKVRNNTISPSTYTAHYGIYMNYCDNAYEVTGNRINLNFGYYGIYQTYCDGTALLRSKIANNSITVAGTTTARGLHSQYCSYLDVYNNTIVCNSSSATAGYAAYFYYSSATYGNNNVYNNIFVNTGPGYAVYNYSPTTVATNKWDYNLMHTNGSLLYQVASPAAVTYANLAAWKASGAGLDSNSISMLPKFISATNLALNLSDSNVWAINGAGIPIAGNSNDINNNPRSTTFAGGAPDLGAYEFTPAVAPPLAVAVPSTPVMGGTQVFLYNNDTIAKIVWSPFYLAPPTIGVRLYRGEFPAGISGSSHHSLNEYWDFDVPTGFYLYDVSLYYAQNLIGSVPNEANLIGAKQSGTDPWSIFSSNSTVSADSNILTITGLNDFSVFTGTTSANPVPVKLTSLKASAVGKDAIVQWTTASERNASHFNVEASTDGRNFKVVGTVKAKGNSATGLRYSFVHENAQREMNARVIYYRLVSVDMDRTSSVSSVVSVNFEQSRNSLEAANLYPNPFTRNITLNVPALASGVMHIEVSDIQGLRVRSFGVDVEKGMNDITLTQLDGLSSGVYFVKLMLNGETTVIKVVRH